jgi:hypothetical protein
MNTPSELFEYAMRPTTVISTAANHVCHRSFPRMSPGIVAAAGRSSTICIAGEPRVRQRQAAKSVPSGVFPVVWRAVLQHRFRRDVKNSFSRTTAVTSGKQAHRRASVQDFTRHY